jgi:hypothetical protein
MSPFVVLILFCNLTYTLHAADVNFVNTRRLQAFAQIGPQKDTKPDDAVEEKSKDEEIRINVKSKAKAEVQPPDSKKPTPSDKEKSTTHAPQKNSTKVDDHKVMKPAEMESGALLRGVAVVVALTVIVIIYMALKTYCSKRSKPLMVNKYGVRTRRSDIEMTPLPLDEDDEDETLFEVSSANR